MTARRTRACAAALVLSSVLTACGAEAPAEQGGGPPTDALNDSLETIEQAWRLEIGDSEVKVRLSDQARCYLQRGPQAADGSMPIGSTALCGPYREMGDDQTSWSVAEIATYPVDQQGSVAVSLVPGRPGRDLFTVGAPNPNQVPWRPDGQEADLAEVVAEPDAPVVAEGTVVEVLPPDDLVAGADELKTPYGTYRISRSTADRVDGPDGHVAAPEDGVFIILDVRGRSGYAEEVEAPTFRLRRGEVAYDLPSATGTFAVAASAGGEDAVVEMEFDGLAQELDASGHRAPHPVADPLYSTRNDLVVSRLVDDVGDYGDEGWSGRVTTEVGTPDAEITPYAAGHGWAPEGKVWLVVETGVTARGTRFRSVDESGRYDVHRTEVTSVAIDGAHVADPTLTSGQDKASLVVVHPVDQETRDFTLTVNVKVTAVRSHYADESLPERGEIDFSLEGPITG